MINIPANPFAVVSAVALFLAATISPALAQATSGGYAVVISEKAKTDAGWQTVADCLLEKHDGFLLTYVSDPAETLPELQARRPRFTCFVTPPNDATRAFVANVHRLTRRLDDDPYTDTFWGILTGFDADNALAIASQAKPLTIHKVASGTEVALSHCTEGVWYCELQKNHSVRKSPGGEPAAVTVPTDTTQALADTLNTYQTELFVTSGHATERDWMIGYRYRNGFFKSKSGELYGEDTKKNHIAIESPNPKVFMPIGNCLMGHIDGPDAMALAFMNSAGVHQMMGYTVPTWYGYQGWGCLDYFVEQPGRYTFTEAFFANHHALIHRLATAFPGLESAAGTANFRPARIPPSSPRAAELGLNQMDATGLFFDRDVVAYYGDPAWAARMAPGPLAYAQSLKELPATSPDGPTTFTFTITPRLGEASFQPVNTNGAQRGWRPIVEHFPFRLEDVRIISANGLKPVVTDDFILIPNPRECDTTRTYEVVFQGKKQG